jgi:hypothetical protein
MLRDLPFGARISDSFVKKQKWETLKANEELPGVLPCLCVEERQRHPSIDRRGPQDKRINFEEGPPIPPTNRLFQTTPPSETLIKERVWVLYFDSREHSPEATFEIDGVELHIPEQEQADLDGATILGVNDEIVVTYEPI